jgi:hypothetical protein
MSLGESRNPHILCSLEVHCHAHKSLLFVTVLSQINPVHIFRFGRCLVSYVRDVYRSASGSDVKFLLHLFDFNQNLNGVKFFCKSHQS